MADKRITELTNEKLILGDGDYTIVDSNEGTYKYELKRIVDSIPEPDTTLSIAGRAADAKATGDEIADVKRDLSDVQNSVGAFAFTFEQGAMQTSANKTYAELKVSATNRVRITDLIKLDTSKTYTLTADFPTFNVSVDYFNANQKSTSGTTWLNTDVIISNTEYIAFAVCKYDNSDITPSDVSGVYIYENNAIANINSDLAEAIADTSANTVGLQALESMVYKPIKPTFVVGVFSYSIANQCMRWNLNSARATADLRFLNMEQGDTIGITDYTTYSIAFGDNGGWYDDGYKTTDVTANNPNVKPYTILVKRNDNADMTDADLLALTRQFHSTKEATEFTLPSSYIPNVKTRNGYIHFSFDDVGYCITNLSAANSTYFSSLWDEPFFGMLKRLHDTYGAVFSLYVWDISNMASIHVRFKQDFENASNWLKFGFHATAEGSLENATAAEAKQDYDTFINNVFSKCGGVNSVDRIPRLNYFKGNLNALGALRDCDCGCIGFLNTDDSRNAYYLTQDELTYLRTHSLWSDRANGLQFISTVMRLDWFVSGFSSQYTYNVPVKDNPYDELVYRYGQPAMADLYSNLIVFTHEWQTYSSSYVLNSAMVDRIEQVCQFANDYNYDFDFPQNRVPNITSNVIA